MASLFAVTCVRSSLHYAASMALEWEQVIVDSADPVALGRWWAEALGWVVVGDAPDEFEIRPEKDRMPGLLFVPVPEPKSVKNRLHLDLHAAAGERESEVQRLEGLGASVLRHVKEPGGEWAVMTDPEGNEFCVQ